MQQASVRNLRYHTSMKWRIVEGEEVQITKRKRVIARLLPVTSTAKPKGPDFKARLKEIYGDKVLKVGGAELLAKELSAYADTSFLASHYTPEANTDLAAQIMKGINLPLFLTALAKLSCRMRCNSECTGKI
jgi:antitoxin (DNA-binding transcriptional repressor) of toxin-antitoxin stability system